MYSTIPAMLGLLCNNLQCDTHLCSLITFASMVTCLMNAQRPPFLTDLRLPGLSHIPSETVCIFPSINLNLLAWCDKIISDTSCPFTHEYQHDRAQKCTYTCVSGGDISISSVFGGLRV